MPEAVRGIPVYMQIQDYYRTRILSGKIKEGKKLPSIAAIAVEWKCAVATAAKAIDGLRVEGYVLTSTQGTFATLGKGADAGIDLAMRSQTDMPGQRIRVTEAGIVDAPVYIAELLGVNPVGARVARRESIAYTGQQPARLIVQWWPAELVPTLDAGDEGEVLERIEQASGRRPSHGRDYFEGREADVREARALGIRPGDPVLASTYVWSDEIGVIEYAEFVLPRKRVVSFSYAIGPAAA